MSIKSVCSILGTPLTDLDIFFVIFLSQAILVLQCTEKIEHLRPTLQHRHVEISLRHQN